jgi:hypothetical protein
MYCPAHSKKILGETACYSTGWDISPFGMIEQKPFSGRLLRLLYG